MASETAAPSPAAPARTSPQGLVSRGLLAAVVFVYVAAFPYHPGLRSPNELCRLWQSRAIVDFGKLSLNETIRDYGPVGDLSVVGGTYYPSKAPLLSFGAVPIYAALKAASGGDGRAVGELPLLYLSRLFLTVLPTLALLWLLRRFLQAYVARPVADALTATYGLGSLALSYSLLFMSHQTTAVLLFAAFFALWRTLRREWPWRGWVVAGAMCGLALLAEYTSALGIAALVLYAALGVLFRERAAHPPAPGADPAAKAERREGLARALALPAALAFLGAVPFIGALMAYHQACFGHPLESGYKHLADAAYQPWHLGGFLGIKVPDPRAFALSFFSPLRGLFTLAPFLLLALPGLWTLHRASREGSRRAELRPLFWLTVALLVGYAYFTSSFSYESWGWTTGPRHMTGLVPFLVLPVALWVEKARAPEAGSELRLALGLGAGLCTASIAITGLASMVNYVPDSVSNPLYGLALPLFHEGYWPPSVFNLLGASTSGPGALLLVALHGAALLAAALLVWGKGAFPRREAAAWAMTTFACLFLLSATARGSDPDLGAQNHLRSVWANPPAGRGR